MISSNTITSKSIEVGSEIIYGYPWRGLLGVSLSNLGEIKPWIKIEAKMTIEQTIQSLTASTSSKKP